MKYRKLGQDLSVSAIGVGCMPMTGGFGGSVYGAADEAEAIAAIRRAVDLGITFFDTAEIYGPLENEALLGRALKGHAHQSVIASKFGFSFATEDASTRKVDGSPANLVRAVEGSLKRLGLDTIDLYYLHRVDTSVPIEETVGAMGELVAQGKIRHVGLSEAGPETLRRAHATFPITALQSEYSLWERGVEDEILPLCNALGIGFVPYSPLGRGFLAGAVPRLDTLAPDDYRHNDPRYAPGFFEANMAIVDVAREIAERHGASPAQVALAWLLQQGDSIVPIPGFKRRATLEDSARAPDLVLDAQDMEELSSAGANVQGQRYGEAAMKMVRL